MKKDKLALDKVLSSLYSFLNDLHKVEVDCWGENCYQIIYKFDNSFGASVNRYEKGDDLEIDVIRFDDNNDFEFDNDNEVTENETLYNLKTNEVCYVLLKIKRLVDNRGLVENERYNTTFR